MTSHESLMVALTLKVRVLGRMYQLSKYTDWEVVSKLVFETADALS